MEAVTCTSPAHWRLPMTPDNPSLLDPPQTMLDANRELAKLSQDETEGLLSWC